MKFARPHTMNGHAYAKGEHYPGGVNTARFLYHRGVLEPDGSPEDAYVTSPKVKKTAWHDNSDTPEPEPEPTPAPKRARTRKASDTPTEQENK